MAFILTDIKNKYVALRGYHTNRHLVVIESDDWGSIRMPSREVFRELQKAGDSPEKDPFLSNDSLESEQDLENLYSVLNSVTGKDGRPAVITANFAVANPDFDRIDREKGIYHYEEIQKTYQRYYPDSDIYGTIQNGIEMGVFFPQLHCREHMNVNRWMQALKNGKQDVLTAYANHMIGIGASFAQDNVFGYMDAFNTICSSDEELAQIVRDAASMFEKMFGFQSETFVASCFVWNRALEKELSQLGIRGIQSACWQNDPVGQGGAYKLKRRIHFTGEKTPFGQYYTVRNCSFEPAYKNDPQACAQHCLREIEKSFSDRKPAIITSHRLNFISEINPHNAKANLEGLRELLVGIVNKYPDVEFVTTPELLKIMEN